MSKVNVSFHADRGARVNVALGKTSMSDTEYAMIEIRGGLSIFFDNFAELARFNAILTRRCAEIAAEERDKREAGNDK